MNQSLTNCKCSVFIGSVAEMKGNEARVVFFLHPVNQLKERRLSNVKPKLVNSGFCFLLLLGLHLALGFLFATVPRPWNDMVYLCAMIMPLSLLVVYLAAILIDWLDPWSKAVLWWRKMRGLPTEEMLLLHTLPYYLAITRCTCEVSNVAFWLDIF